MEQDTTKKITPRTSCKATQEDLLSEEKKKIDEGNDETTVLLERQKLTNLLTNTTCIPCVSNSIKSKIEKLFTEVDKLVEGTDSVEDMNREYKKLKERYRKNKDRDIKTLLSNCFYKPQLTTCGIAQVCRAVCNEHSIKIQDTRSEYENKNVSGQTKAIDYEENLRMLAAVYYTGIGGTEMGDILSFLNLPNSHNFVRTHTRYISFFTDIIKTIVEDEMEEALWEEVEATIVAEKGQVYYDNWLKERKDNREIVGLTISYDCGWQKKSSGRKYDSKSGHAFLVGAYTRKIVGCIVFSKNCKQCECMYKKYYPTMNQTEFEAKEDKYMKEYLKYVDSKWLAKKKNLPFSDVPPENPHNIFSKPLLCELDMCQLVNPSQLIGKTLDIESMNHECVRNFSGSSGAMEANGLVLLAKKMHKKYDGKMYLHTIICDDDSKMRKVMQHPYTKPNGKVNQGGDLPMEIPVPEWFADPNHRAKSVGNVMFELVKTNKEMTKLDALRIKKYYSFYVKQNRGEGIDELMKNRMCPIDHLFDDHTNCNPTWCEKKRIEIEKINESNSNIVTPSKTQTNNELNELDNVIRTSNDSNEEFGRMSDGYYRCKVRDKDLYLAIKKKYESYVTKEKLEECTHEFDSNINESLNNIVSKYAPKRKHFSKSLSLFTRVYIAAGIYLLGYHYLWCRIFVALSLSIPSKLKMCWMRKDIEKVKKYGVECTTKHKKKRKMREYCALAKEVKHRQKDIKTNYEYGPSVGMERTLVKKAKTNKNYCSFAEFGCDGKYGHKTNKSKHCKFYMLAGAALEAAKGECKKSN